MSLQYTVAVKYEIILEGYPMKKIIALLLSVLMILGMAACASNSSTPAATTTDTTADTTADTTTADTSAAASTSSGSKLRFVTGGESGTYYAFGSVIAQHATNNAGIDVVGLVGNGSPMQSWPSARPTSWPTPTRARTFLPIPAL